MYCYKFYNYATGELVESTSYGWRKNSRRFFCEDDDFRFLGHSGYMAEWGGPMLKWTHPPVGRRRVNFQRGYRAVG